jgi:glucose-1-phosphate cytidylyltransferase
MKVVLFCGGLGTRIRDYSENIPKPMVPVGHQPIIWHVMQYYSHYGHNDFVLCLGYKANIIKEFFINYKPAIYRDCVISSNGEDIKMLGGKHPDWRVTLVDTGIWRNIGERLYAVREHLAGEEYFLANYSDGLTDVNLPAMIDFFKKSGKIGCFLAVRPPVTYHLVDFGEQGEVQRFRTSPQSDIWINGGYFIFRPEIFDHMRPGEELVVEPFQRLIDAGQLCAYRHTGFWMAMDTLKEKQSLEDLFDRGVAPWQPYAEKPQVRG